MGLRRQARELALQALYAHDAGMTDGSGQFGLVWEHFVLEADEPAALGPAVNAFARELFAGVLENRAVLDELIEEKSKNWTLTRMARVDLNILRLAAFELLYRPDIPTNVTLNEAIEIAKKYGTEDSAAFVNGILDEIAVSVGEKPGAHIVPDE